MILKSWMEPSRPLVAGVVIPHHCRGLLATLVTATDLELYRSKGDLHPVSDWPDADLPKRSVLTKDVGADRLYVARHRWLGWCAGIARDIRIETPDSVHTYMVRPGERVVARLDASRDIDETLRRIYSDAKEKARIAEAERRGDPVVGDIAAAGVVLGYISVDEAAALGNYVHEGEPIPYVPLGSPLPQP